MLKIILVFIILFCLVLFITECWSGLDREKTYKLIKLIGKFWVISLVAFAILTSIVILF